MDSEHTPERPEATSTGNGPTPPRMSVEPTPEPDHTEGTDSAGKTDYIPFVPSTATERHTVVKTKTKKLPVFLASFGGLVVGAVLVIALVMTGAFRISDTDVTADVPTTQTIDIDAEDTTRGDAHELDHTAVVDRAGGDELREHERKGALDAGSAERCELELAGLLPRCVRGMIGGDSIDRTIRDSGDKRLRICGGAQRRVHLEARVIRAIERILGKEEVVRRGLAGHGQALRLGSAH